MYVSMCVFLHMYVYVRVCVFVFVHVYAHKVSGWVWCSNLECEGANRCAWRVSLH